MRPDSDIDLLIEFDPDHIPGLLTLAGMEIDLSEIIGRKVDLRTPQDLSRYFRQEVVDSAEVQYAERNVGMTFDFVRHLIEHPDIINTITDGAELDFIDKDMPTKERERVKKKKVISYKVEHIFEPVKM